MLILGAALSWAALSFSGCNSLEKREVVTPATTSTTTSTTLPAEPKTKTYSGYTQVYKRDMDEVLYQCESQRFYCECLKN